MEKFIRGSEISCCWHMPNELVIEILLRLPVESLVRFRTVCKYWYSVITSSDFIKNHFNYHTKNNHSHILVYHSILCPTLETRFAVFSDESLALLHHDLEYLRIPRNLAHIIGPVNGLFLLCHGEHMRLDNYRLALLNPATREMRTFFVPDSNQKPHLWSCLHTFGFGFDHLKNDFKVVAFWDLDDRRTGLPIGLINIAVYSLANDCWKHLDPYRKTRHNSPCAYSGTLYFDGACYWLSADDNTGYSLLSFDIGHELLREIKGPQNTMSKNARLLLYNNDSLAMFLSTYGHSKIDLIELMVMKEEGCWTKHLTVNVSLLGVIQPLGLWKNSKLFLDTRTRTMTPDNNLLYHLFAFSRKLVLYNPMFHDTEEFGIQDYDPAFLKVFSYQESLVSLKGRNKDWDGYNLSDRIQDFCNVRAPEVIEDFFWCEQCMIDISRCTCGDLGDLVEEEDEDNNEHNEYEEAEQQQN